MSDAPLPEPTGPQDVYTEDSFRHDCMGAERRDAAGGSDLDPLYGGYAEQAALDRALRKALRVLRPGGRILIHTMPTSLRRALRGASFPAPDVTPGACMYTDFVPEEAARRMYHRLAAHRLAARPGKGDLWARAQAPA